MLNKLPEIETQEWLDSIDGVLERESHETVIALLKKLESRVHDAGVRMPFTATTPYINSISHETESPYPGDRAIERRIKSFIRWNAMAMVVRANRQSPGIGGHISTYASAATLYEVGFNHFFRAASGEFPGDMVYFQGHASPGIYARAFLEGRLGIEKLEDFRRELSESGGLSSYPHPWLMPDFWQFPTVSMGLGPLMAIYQARFNRYLEHRGLKKPTGEKVWAFVGDGETDEPESLGSISLAGREKLDNLIFVVNCNLQRLDGPVRGNGQIIQELEAMFRGAGWNVIKVMWGSDWDKLFAADKESLLIKRVSGLVDGELQKAHVDGGAAVRRKFFGKFPKLLKLVEEFSDDELHRLKRGGHDPQKVYSAYKAAVDFEGKPTVILASTIKGYGLGEAGEGRNVTHQQKKLNEAELKEFRTRFDIPISDAEIADAPFYRPPEDGPEVKYLKDRRAALGGPLPARRAKAGPIEPLADSFFTEFDAGTADREVSTTMAFVRILTKLLKDKQIGKLIVPIISDEARTFGMEALFRQCGIYSNVGQLYEPVDSDQLLHYREAKDGQILEEGITEAGSVSSLIAAGTAYANHGINTIPFFIFYSMFGMQRVGDLVWAAGDMRVKGFLVGGTSGRTTLAGEGLQHQDGNSHLLAFPVPNLAAYDPAFAFEIAAIVRDGIKRMYVDREDLFYYLTVGNENYPQPARPEGVSDADILGGMYLFRQPGLKKAKTRVRLFGSGAILNEALKAAERLEGEFKIAAEVWSVTSWKNLYLDARETERRNLLNPDKEPAAARIARLLAEGSGPCVAATDYVRALPESVAKHFPGGLTTLGTDGFGRSEDRTRLRDFFEVDSRFIALAAIGALRRAGDLDAAAVKSAMSALGIKADKPDPFYL